MNNILIAITIGIAAGLIDAIPMIIRKLAWRDTLMAFIHYFVLGVIIPFVSWDMAPWFTGICISFLSAVPVMIGVYPTDKQAIIPIFVFSILLGAGIGLAGAVFII